MAERTTESLFLNKLNELKYPKADIGKEDIRVWSQTEFKGHDDYLESAFKHASKRKGRNGEGKPEFVIRDKNRNLIIVVECKPYNSQHSSCCNLEDFNNMVVDLKDKTTTEQYAVDGALHYASFIKSDYDVIAIGVSGNTSSDYRMTSILWPKGKTVKDIVVVEDGGYDNTLMTYRDYERYINKKLNRNIETKKEVLVELKRYANACNNFLRLNGISANDRAGFISGVIIALTDSEFRNKAEKEALGSDVVDLIKKALIRVWNEDELPILKKEKLDEYYSGLFVNSLVTDKIKKDKKYFKQGENKLSSCVYSIHRNITLKVEYHEDIDIMGTFYTSFLKYAKGDAKDKGIVLTPKHTTELFCDLAEFYLGRPLNEKTPVLDICTGTGGFLIGSLNRMFDNIDKMLISESEKAQKREYVTKYCLLGVEFEPSMFALAYANMRFHKDGRSNLFVGSSLLSDELVIDKSNGKDITLKETLKAARPKVGMINPPYSQKNGRSELDFVYSLLEYLDDSGDSIGIAIVPLSCTSKSEDSKLRTKILEKHTLLGVMTMPKNLFADSKVATSTCIMVFKAHQAHDSSKEVFLGRWGEDGFVVVPHNGRIDKDNKYIGIKEEWFNELKNKAEKDDTKYMWKKLTGKDEWLAEAYIETDYSKLTDKDFEIVLKKYALFKYMVNKEINLLESTNMYWLLENVDFKDFDNKYFSPVTTIGRKINLVQNTYNIFDLFDYETGSNSCSDIDDSFDIPMITTTTFNNGVSGFVPESAFEGNKLTLSKNGACCDVFYQEKPFDTNSDVLVLTLKHGELNPYIAMYLKVIIEQEKKQFDYSYRKASVTRLKNVRIGLPSKLNDKNEYEPDWDYMESYIKSLPYSSAL